MHVKKNDKVMILTGKDREFTGEVIEVDPKNLRVKVARRNMMIKHRRPNPITGEEGARVEKEAWIDASNVALYNEELERWERTHIRWRGFGGELFETRKEARDSFDEGEVPDPIQKVRVGKKSGEAYD